VTSTVPAGPAGEVAVIELSLNTVNEVAAVVPKVTLVAPVKPVPVMVTEVPPATVPAVGITAVTVGVELGAPDITITALTCCPSTIEVIVATPKVVGVNIVVFMPDKVVPVMGWRLPLRPVSPYVIGIPSGTFPFATVLLPVESYVRLT